MSASPAAAPAVPAWLEGHLDDTGALPPDGRPLPRVLQGLAPLRSGEYAATLGALAVTEQQLTHLATGDLPVHLVVTAGAGAVEAALRWVTGPGADRVTLRSLEIALRDEDDLAHNARRFVAVLDSVEGADDVSVHAALPATASPSAGWLAALDELAAREVGVVVRPASPAERATLLEAALDRELPLRFTTAGGTGAVAALRATRVALDGEGPEAVAAALDDVAAAVAWATGDPATATRTRRWCRAASVPSTALALAELADAGLLPGPPAGSGAGTTP